MNIVTRGICGLVLDTEGRNPIAREEIQTAEPTGHFILKRYRVDDDGHICLTPSLPLSQLSSSLDVLKAELDGLLTDIERRFPDTALKRHLAAST